MTTAAPFRILVVEDEPGLRRFTSEWLREAGYETRTAENGAEALAALGWDPDLILLDLGMPVMDGWQFLDRLTASPSSPAAATAMPARSLVPPVIVLTGRPRRQAELPRGAAAMLEKPFDFELLGRSIARYAGAFTG